MTRYALPRSSDAALPSLRMQMARYGYLRGKLPEPFFDLPVTFADAMCFEPVNFGFISVTIILTNQGDSLHFPPPRTSVVAPQATFDPHPTTGGDDLNISNQAEDFKVGRLHLPRYDNLFRRQTLRE